jgi:hypothetical protein
MNGVGSETWDRAGDDHGKEFEVRIEEDKLARRRAGL